MGIYATDTLKVAPPPRTDLGRARQHPVCGQKPLRGPIHNAISGYRYFNPELGRWINRDPIEEAGGKNLYGFIRNSPVYMLDFLGLLEFVNDGTLIEEAVQQIRRSVKTFMDAQDFLNEEASDLSPDAINKLGYIQADSGIEIFSQGAVVLENINKIKDFYTKARLLADIIEGKDDANSAAAAHLSEAFIKKVIGATALGKGGAIVILEAGNISAGMGNWMSVHMVRFLSATNCKCCVSGFASDGRIGPYTGDKPSGMRAPQCYSDGFNYWAESISIPNRVRDGLFATIYKVSFERASKLMVKCE